MLAKYGAKTGDKNNMGFTLTFNFQTSMAPDPKNNKSRELRLV